MVVLVQRALAIGGVLLFVIASGCGRPADDRASIATATPTGESSLTTTASPSIAPTSSPTPTPAGTPRVETSSIVLDLAIGPGYDQPAATTAGVGGLTSYGPTSLAVDRDGRIYLWDHARVRILVYEGGKLAHVLPEPFVEMDSYALLAYGGRLYLRSGFDNVAAEYEIDATSGELLRLGLGIYPRERAPRSFMAGKGPNPPIGSDLLGNAYDRSFIPRGYEIRRVDRSGTVTAISTTDKPATEGLYDSYVTGDGAVYDLRHSYGGARVDRVRVVKLLGPAAAAPAEATAPITDRPSFAGREAPASVEIFAAPELPLGTLTGSDARSLWWLFATSRSATSATGSPPNIYRLTANWPDGSSMPLTVDGRSPGMVGRALAHVMSRPAFVIDALRRYGARIRIPDVPGTERALTSAEVSTYADALGSAFTTTFYERYRPLEDPFAIRQLTITYPGGTVVLQDVGDRYLRTGSMMLGAWVHDGRASTLLRRWLPTPSFARDDPAILFTAEKVTLPDQDISRWKASIVRVLVLPSSGTGQGTWDDQGPLTFTFTLPGGRTEVVRVDAKGYTFAGRTYDKLGLLDLHGYKGVP